MFKPSTIRSASSLTRLPLRTRAYSQFIRNEGDYRVQHVRFRQPSFFTRRRAGTFALYATAFGAARYYFLPMLDEIEDADEEDEAEHEHEERQTEEIDEDSIFIPLGWARPVPRRFYKGSDPEWQEFKKLSQDNKRIAAMQHQLVSLIRSKLASTPGLRMGTIDLQAGRFWLDITFPDGPPQEYERSGLEITDNYIAWTTHPVSQQNYHRLQRLLWPTAAFNSVYVTGRYIFNSQLLRVKQFFGLAPQPEDQFEQLRQQLELATKAVRRSAEGKGDQKGLPPPSSTAPTSERSTAAPPPQLPGMPAASTNSPNPDQQKALLSKIHSLPDGRQVPIALSIFMSTLAKGWKPLSLEPPRGSVLVSGLVEVRGSRVRVIMEVVAAYDPKTDQYVQVQGAIKRVQPRRQAPKGGP